MESMKKKYSAYIPVPEGSLMINTYRELMDYRISHRPDVTLYRCKNHQTGEEMSVMPEEFRDQVDGLAAWLNSRGYRRTHIAILGENSYQWVLAMFAVICSDNVLVTLDKGLEYVTLNSIFGRSDSSVLFYSKEYAETASKLAAEYGAEVFPLEEALRLSADGRALPGREPAETDPDAMAVLMYTSGTTGPAKGVMLSQRNIMSDMLLTVFQSDFTGDTIYLLPLNHIYGLGPSLLEHFVTGGTSTISLNLRYMLKDIQEARPEIMFVVPAFLELMYHSLWKGIAAKGMTGKVNAAIEQIRGRGDVPGAVKREMFRELLAALGGRLTRIVSGGAPMNIRYYEGFRDFGIEILNGYGITEGAPVLAVNMVEANRPLSVGRLIMGEEIRIDSPDGNGDGEICVRGPNVMLGYYKDDEETRKALKDGWLYTGDKGCLDEDNYIYINGRLKNLIILANGENVSPEELEGMLGEDEAILESVVYERDGKICAQIVRNDDYIKLNGIEDPDAQIRGFIAELNRNLAVYKRINTVEFRDTPFEHTTSRKIKRPG